MSDERFEKDCDENVCSFDYSTLDTYYEYNDSHEEIIEWNKHSSNAQYRNLKHIAEILNIKQMRLESLMKHREEVGKLFDRIDEQQSIIEELRLQEKEKGVPVFVVRDGKNPIALFFNEQRASLYCQENMANLTYQQEKWCRVK